TYKAMHLAVKKLKTKPELLLIDVNRFKPFKDVPHVCIIKGDSQYLSIAAASVLAKNYRDKLMKDLHQLYPNYGWIKNVGYPTVEHRTGIEKFGVTPYHRLSFQLLKKQLDLFD
ncbi:MAG: ribonuclease HII, partial [Chryseotalea sp.]